MTFFSRSREIDEPSPVLIEHRAAGNPAAIVFIGGLHGHPIDTWGAFPEVLEAEPSLEPWDVLSVGYGTNLRLDLARVWSAAPSLHHLTLLLRGVAGAELAGYRRLALVAHGMGGLIVQRALIDDSELAARTSHLFLFATPSGGLAKAGQFRPWRRQLQDMAEGGKFIETLRRDWTSRFSEKPPFRLLAITASEDEFVAPGSSLGPFAPEQQAVVAGDHLGIVRPSGRDHPSVRVVVNHIEGDAAPAGPLNAARVAVELGGFQRAVEHLEPHEEDLDADDVVSLALALDAVGRRDAAIELIERHRGAGTSDAMGVLAGRLKRRWLAAGRSVDAERAHTLYRQAGERALQDENPRQAFEHAINVAFLELAHHKKRETARTQARLALHQVRRSGDEDQWALATQAEAFLYLGERESALSKYRQALAETTSLREVESIFQQAIRVAGLLEEPQLVTRLTSIFRSSVGSASVGA